MRLFRPGYVSCSSQKGSRSHSASRASWRGVGFSCRQPRRYGTTWNGSRSNGRSLSQSRLPIDRSPDQLLWSPTRINAWRGAIAEPGRAPLAVLRIPKVRLEAAVLPGTDDRTLDRGLGHIEYTAQPGTVGNSGIAGHRDSFFRALKDIAEDDLIELDTPLMTDVYRVERTWIVSPDDVSVLDPTPMRALTLVTCYPFYYVGSAPKRFIVRAVRVSSKPVSWRPLGRSSRSSHFS